MISGVISKDETAQFIRHFLRHPLFRTQAQRIGKVARAHEDGVAFWTLKQEGAQEIAW